MVFLTAAARPNSKVPTPRSMAASGIVHCSEAGAITPTANRVATGAESSESANPTGTTRAATSAASNRTRYRFLIHGVISIDVPSVSRPFSVQILADDVHRRNSFLKL